MTGLQIHNQKHRWYRSWKFTKSVVNILSLKRNAFFESFIVHFGGRTHSMAIFPRSRVSGWKGPPGPNLRLHAASTANLMFG